MIRTIIFIPVSRADHLDRLFHSLEVLDGDKERTALLTYVDGDTKLFLETRNRTELSKFAERLCVQRPGSKTPAPLGLLERRRRIAAVHNEAKELLPTCEYVMGVEDDTIVPVDALSRLLSDYAAHPYAGFIEGVELGRWGVPYVGAWRADDVYEPSRIESAMPPDGAAVEEIDAGGFYCYLTRRQQFVDHQYEPYDGSTLGPDVNYGLWLRQQGFKNYIDWSIRCRHYQRNGNVVSLATAQPRHISFTKRREQWTQNLAA